MAFINFASHIKIIAKNFKDHAIILRMKDLKEGDLSLIIDKFHELDNFFICADYSKEKISYRLCKDADLIISVQTSLAEESLAYGKKVILINELFPISNMCSAVYPNIYHFTITNSPKETIKLAKIFLTNNKNIIMQFKSLQNHLSGDKNINDKKYIPKVLEKLLLAENNFKI